jgi:hypothetical protein
MRAVEIPGSARTTDGMPGGNKHGASHAVSSADASSETSPVGQYTDRD